MRKVRCVLWTALLLLGVAGCSGKEKAQEEAERSETKKIEDYVQGNDSIMKTESGYYYYDLMEDSLRYYDLATGMDMYLCNKPECKHDGNSFCIATNDKYSIQRLWLYGDRLYAAVLESTDTQYLLKVIDIALDASEMNEIATYMSVEKTGMLPMDDMGGRKVITGLEDEELIFRYEPAKLVIHRNKVVLPFGFIGQDGLEDSVCYGTAILDLDTKKVTYLNEEPLSKENPQTKGFFPYEDNIYYYQKEGRKNILHRYNIVTGTDESYTLQPGFDGTFVVKDEDTILYKRSQGNMLYFYYPSTGETEEAVSLGRKSSITILGEQYEQNRPCDIRKISSDGTYLYIADSAGTTVYTSESKENPGVEEERREHNVFLYILRLSDLEVVKVFNFLNFGSKDEQGEIRYSSDTNQVLSYVGEEVYFCSWYAGKKAFYKCNRSDFLNGTPEFEYVFGGKLDKEE